MLTDFYRGRHRGPTRRRAVVVVQTAAAMTALLGFAALTVDLGAIHNAKADLQRAADAAALAAVQEMGADADAYRIAAATRRAEEYVERNSVLGRSLVVESGDVTFGALIYNVQSGRYDFSPTTDDPEAVRVHVRMSDDSVNGALPLYFAKIFGKHTVDLSAVAIAGMDGRLSAYETDSACADVLPLSMDRTEYNNQLRAGHDDYGFDPENDLVGQSPDGSPEIVAYPADQAPGNFGLVNIGIPNQGLTELAYQMENGVSPEDFMNEIGDTKLTFFRDGTAITHDFTGNSGFKASLEASIKKKIGEVIAIFVHDSVVEGGANAVYRIVGIRFGRVMDVKLQENNPNRGIWIQPISYHCDGVITAPDAPTDGVAVRYGLVE